MTLVLRANISTKYRLSDFSAVLPMQEAGVSTNCEFANPLISRLQRMAGFMGRIAESRSRGQGLESAVNAGVAAIDVQNAAPDLMAAKSPT